MSHSTRVELEGWDSDTAFAHGSRRLVERRVEGSVGGVEKVNNWTYYSPRAGRPEPLVDRFSLGLMPPSTPHAF
jgi:hypothetical protein